MPMKQLQRVMETELGEDWRDKFERFDDEPMAAASIGQVHHAVLPSGDHVAVKVQYPGVANSIDSDLDNLQRLVCPARVVGLSPLHCCRCLHCRLCRRSRCMMSSHLASMSMKSWMCVPHVFVFSLFFPCSVFLVRYIMFSALLLCNGHHRLQERS